MTVKPGYILRRMQGSEQYRGISIRGEDDVSGAEPVTKSLSSGEKQENQALMAAARKAMSVIIVVSANWADAGAGLFPGLILGLARGNLIEAAAPGACSSG